MSAKREAVTGEQLWRMLSERYAPPTYCLFGEVANATGSARARSADAIGMSLWPSRGLELMGFEIKASRSDWTRELCNPAKAEAVARFMDRWWLVVADRELVKAGELPPAWGLLAPGRGAQKGSLVAVVDAPKLTGGDPLPKVWRPFLAAFLRRAHEAMVRPGVAELAKAKHEGWEEGYAAGERTAEGEAARLKRAVDAFEEAAGVKLDRWDTWRSTAIGAAIKLALGYQDPGRMARTFEEMRNTAAAFVRNAEPLIELLRTEPDKPAGDGDGEHDASGVHTVQAPGAASVGEPGGGAVRVPPAL